MTRAAALSPERAVALATLLLSNVVGPSCPARFFLAGGAFKTLLHGRPPRDLDLWAATPQDRDWLLDTLAHRGAAPLEARPFADAFKLAGHIVEVPHKAEYAVLEERLARFDIALSAVGVEHSPGAPLRAVIHPLAVRSVEQEAVLLLKPLVNWKYALATLARMRRYAEELAYRIPAEEESEVWTVFHAQPLEMREGLLDRLRRLGNDDRGVGQEAQCRLHR